MSPQERKVLLKLQNHDNYNIQWVGNYLEITEIPNNEDDREEQTERICLAVFNSINQKNILFVSQELIDEQRKTTKVVQQTFLQYVNQNWENINYTLPEITTQTFLEEGESLSISDDHIYYDLRASNIHYLQAQLKHEDYPDKDEIAKKEAYKVALVWTGDEFRLDRQALVQYDISEYHED